VIRGDRAVGYARSQYDLVHTHAPYDIAVDTTPTTPESTREAVTAIQGMLAAPPESPFFARIRSGI